MSRFTYTAPDGTRVELPDIDALREHVAVGKVRNDTPFYDASTGLEGPAERHQAYRFVRDLQLGESGVDSSAGPVTEGSDGPDQGRDAGEDLDFAGIDITLAEEDDELDPDEVVRRLLKEREREAEPGVRRLRLNPYNETLRAWDGDPPWEEGPPSHAGEEAREEGDPGDEELELEMELEEEEEEEEEEPVAAPAATAPAAPDEDWGTQDEPLEVNPPEGSLTNLDYPPADRHQRPRRSVRRPAPRPTRSTRSTRAPRRGSFVTRALLLVLVAGAAGYLVLRSGAATVPDPGGEGTATAPVDPAGGLGPGAEGVDPSGVAGMLAASEGEAFRDMVAGMDSLARAFDVFQVPAAWLESEYLADADRHPQVREFWQRYAAFVSELRRQDQALFRQGYLNRLDAMGVSSSVATMRLAEAQRRFEETQSQRDAKYASMDDLSRVALQLHDLLAARSDDLIHDPITATRAPEEPALQVRTEDLELRDQIWAALDRIFEDLGQINGQTRWTRDDMTGGVLEGIGSTGGSEERDGSGA